ncbi:penicillin-binding transpeptidase domain-containing protein [Nannocystaceae bacterium ST9]
MPRIHALVLVLACAGCAGEPAQPVEPSTTDSKPEPESESTTELAIDWRPALGDRIREAGYVGTFVLLDPATDTLIVAEPEPPAGTPSLAETGFLPASTFKIPTSLIALETGVADGPEFPLTWDGVERDVEAWNHDHVLRTAYQSSVVWYYQELARRIGAERMQHFVDAFEYGNRDIGGAIDHFWLEGALRISPREQVEFLRRLHEGALPVADHNLALMLDDVMVHERRADKTIIRAKTGWADAETQNIGWFVGSVERADRSRVYFATLILAGQPAPETFRADRIALSFALLGELGWLEAAAL